MCTNENNLSPSELATSGGAAGSLVEPRTCGPTVCQPTPPILPNLYYFMSALGLITMNHVGKTEKQERWKEGMGLGSHPEVK